MNTCKECIHAEMCKWIDELEGRGCDFYDDKPCELLILKSDILLHQDDRKKWSESIKREKESGVIILPPYFKPLLVPNDIEINIEQEPCDDAISRILKKMWNCRGKHTTSIDKVAMEQIIRDELSVTQKPIECDDAISRQAVLDGLKECMCEDWVKTLFATMVKQLPSVTQKSETETWNGMHGQITAPKGTFKKIFEDAESEE